MNNKFFIVSFPIKNSSVSHIYIHNNTNSYIQRCNMNRKETSEIVCEISKEELKSSIKRDKTIFCPECIRYQSELIL